MHYQSKQDLAMAYFPDRSKESAGKLLAREIHSNADLMADFIAAKYVKTRKQLTPPLQVQIIIKHLGEP